MAIQSPTNRYSGSSLYNAWLSGGWNVAFTLFPVVTFGVLDRDLEVTTILQYPKVYLRGQFHRLFNVRVFLQYVATALIHSLIVFLFGVYGSSVGTVDVYFRYAIEILLGQDWNMDMDLLGILINGSLVLAVNTKMAMETQYWTVAHLAAILGSITFWFVQTHCRPGLWDESLTLVQGVLHCYLFQYELGRFLRYGRDHVQ